MRRLGEINRESAKVKLLRKKEDAEAKQHPDAPDAPRPPHGAPRPDVDGDDDPTDDNADMAMDVEALFAASAVGLPTDVDRKTRFLHEQRALFKKHKLVHQG